MSWSVPIAVLLVVPLGVVGALLAAHPTRLDNDIYFQVALITIGVPGQERDSDRRIRRGAAEEGMVAVENTWRRRKRPCEPILMTSFAFIFLGRCR